MNVTISSRGVRVTPQLEEVVLEKVNRLERLLYGLDRAEVHLSEERNPRNRQRGGGADQRDDIGVVLQIVRQNGADYLGFVPETRGEERPQRSSLRSPAYSVRERDLVSHSRPRQRFCP